MGGQASRTQSGSAVESGHAACTNDFELVVRASKELETLLANAFGATGQGLHEKISSSAGLPVDLAKRMRYVATLRNRLVHDLSYNALDDRASFVAAYTDSRARLLDLIRVRQDASAIPAGVDNGNTAGYCIIM